MNFLRLDDWYKQDMIIALLLCKSYHSKSFILLSRLCNLRPNFSCLIILRSTTYFRTVFYFKACKLMYSIFLSLHSLVRWFVLISLLTAIFAAYQGWLSDRVFSKRDHLIRHWTATIAHIQLIIGLWLYFISPVIDYFLHDYKDAVHQRETRFFGMEHGVMMMTAIVIITIGSAKAKPKQTDKEKFRTMALWFTVGLLIILISIPWPFSPFAQRPLYRNF